MIFTAIMKKFSIASQIRELVEITAKGKTISLRNDFCDQVIPNNELYSIVHKFADDHEAIKIIRDADYKLAMAVAKAYPLDFDIQVLPKFEEFYVELYEEARKEKDRMDESRIKKAPEVKKLQDETEANKDALLKKSGCWISYSENSREIILNDFFLISKPDFNSENEQVFYYLYRNPNRTIEKSEIEENFKANQTLTKDFHKIVENLKFKKDLRKAFFDISQDSIKFFNPVSKERLQELGIKNIPIKVE